jgi:type IV pilus assembly protein PilY1
MDRRALAPSPGAYSNPAAGAACQGNYVLIIGSGPPGASGNGGAAFRQRPQRRRRAGAVGAAAPIQRRRSRPARTPRGLDGQYAALLRQAPYPSSRARQRGGARKRHRHLRHRGARSAAWQRQHGRRRIRPGLLLKCRDPGRRPLLDAIDASAVAQAVRAIIAEIRPPTLRTPRSLPPSLDAPGTYLNQVYMGMFRPDATGSPRWSGNLSSTSSHTTRGPGRWR